MTKSSTSKVSQKTKREKIFATRIIELLSLICKKFFQIKKNKDQESSRKMGKGFEQSIPKKRNINGV